MVDEETDAELKILSASIADPYILLIRDDNSAFVAEINKDYELEEIERDEGTLTSTKWVTGCLYNDTTGAVAAPPAPGVDNILMFLYSETGQFHVSCTVYTRDGDKVAGSNPSTRYTHFQP